MINNNFIWISIADKYKLYLNWIRLDYINQFNGLNLALRLVIVYERKLTCY